MSINKTIKRELEVAFAKNPQPVWLRILKYVLLIGLIYFLWKTKWLWLTIAGLIALALVIHFWYRHKTKGWTRSFGGWKYREK